jgi:hypothetical protein
MLRLISKRPISIKITVASLLLLAFTSIGGGRILLDDPSGSSMGIQSMMPSMPLNLHDFFLVGVWLIAVYGAVPIILAVGLWFGKKWAWLGALGLGAVLVTWILGEVYLFYSFGFTIFYPLIGGIGLLVIAMLCFRSTREYCKA